MNLQDLASVRNDEVLSPSGGHGENNISVKPLLLWNIDVLQHVQMLSVIHFFLLQLLTVTCNGINYLKWREKWKFAEKLLPFSLFKKFALIAPLQWMGAARMRAQIADENITIIHK